MTCACAIAGFVLLNLAVIAACFLGALNLDLFIFLFFLASKLLVPFAEESYPPAETLRDCTFCELENSKASHFFLFFVLFALPVA